MMRSLTDEEQRPPWLLQFRSSTAFIIATVWTSSFTDLFLYAMIVPIMPTALVERAGIPYEDREYWVSILLMAEAGVAFISCPIFGYLVDVAPSRRQPYLLGLIFLGASMGLLAGARTITLFIVARLLQGGATAMVAVAGLSLLTDSVSFDNLGQTIGYQGSAVALGFLLGPLLGGIVYETAGYNSVFAMAFVLISIDLIMRIAVIEKQAAQRWIDESALIPDQNRRTHREGYQSFVSPRHATSGEIEPTAITPQETSHKRLSIFLIMRQPRVVISSFALLVQGILYSAFDSTLPVFVETYFNWTPLGAGLVFLPSSLTAIFGPFFGYLSDRYGNRPIAFSSFLLLTIPLICLRLVNQNTPAHVALLLILVAMAGFLMNFSLPSLYVETQQVLEEMEHASPGVFGEKGAIAQAFGLQTMAQFLGMFIGPLWGGFVEYRFGWQVMTLSLGGLAGATAVPMLWLSSSGSAYDSPPPPPSSSSGSSSSFSSEEGVIEREGERERLLS